MSTPLCRIMLGDSMCDKEDFQKGGEAVVLGGRDLVLSTRSWCHGEFECLPLGSACVTERHQLGLSSLLLTHVYMMQCRLAFLQHLCGASVLYLWLHLPAMPPINKYRL
jgi:hypothetical protein